MDKKFAAVDRRFDAVDKRIDALDTKVNMMYHVLDKWPTPAELDDLFYRIAFIEKTLKIKVEMRKPLSSMATKNAQGVPPLIALGPTGLKVNTTLVTKFNLNRFDFANVKYRKKPKAKIFIHFVEKPSMVSIPVMKTRVATITLSCHFPFKHYSGLYVPTKVTGTPRKEEAFVIEPLLTR